jgi:hypothetical protein
MQVTVTLSSSEMQAAYYFLHICNTAFSGQRITAPTLLTTDLGAHLLLYVRDKYFIYSKAFSLLRIYRVSIQAYYPAVSHYVSHLKSLVVDGRFQSSSQMLLHERHWTVCLIAGIVRHSLPWTHWYCGFPSSLHINSGFSLFSYLHLVFSCSRIIGPSPPHFRSFYLTISLSFLGRIQPDIIARQNGIICITKTHTNTHTLSLSLASIRK